MVLLPTFLDSGWNNFLKSLSQIFGSSPKYSGYGQIQGIGATSTTPVGIGLPLRKRENPYVTTNTSSAVGRSSSGIGGGSTVKVTGPTSSAASTYEDTITVPEEIYGEWTPYLEYLREQSEKNTAFSVEQAERQNAWQRETNQIQMDFNAAEAQKNRDWQEMMSNTAHQREIADLQAAGLNPVLSATGGNGAAVTSGASASASTSSGTKGEYDNTFVLGLLSFLNNVMGYATSTATAGINAGGMMGAAGLNSAATRYSADQHAAATMAAAETSYLSAQNNPATLAGLGREFLRALQYDASKFWSGDFSNWSKIFAPRK